VRAWTAPRAPDLDDFADLSESETEAARLRNEPKRHETFRPVDSVSRCRTAREWKNTGTLVQAQRLSADTALSR